MQAALIERPGLARTTTLPDAAAGPADVLVAVAACGVCGTDVHILHGGFRADYPLTPGHEFSGRVVAVGAQVHGLQPGDRVVIDPNIACGTCPYCRRGLVHLCEHLTALGVNLPGGFAELCRVPVAQAYRLPDALADEAAAFTEPLACCLHGLDRARLQTGDSAVVLGAGPIGLLMLQLVEAAGVSQLVSVDPVAAKRELALALGATTALHPEDDVASVVRAQTGLGADVAFDCVGRPETALAALSLVRRGGTVVLFGVCPREAEIALRPYDVFLNELTIVGSYVNPFTHSRAIELLASGRVDVGSLVSHRLPLGRFAEALEIAGGGNALKVLVSP